MRVLERFLAVFFSYAKIQQTLLGVNNRSDQRFGLFWIVLAYSNCSLKNLWLHFGFPTSHTKTICLWGTVLEFAFLRFVSTFFLRKNRSILFFRWLKNNRTWDVITLNVTKVTVLCQLTTNPIMPGKRQPKWRTTIRILHFSLSNVKLFQALSLPMLKNISWNGKVRNAYSIKDVTRKQIGPDRIEDI